MDSSPEQQKKVNLSAPHNHDLSPPENSSKENSAENSRPPLSRTRSRSFESFQLLRTSFSSLIRNNTTQDINVEDTKKSAVVSKSQSAELQRKNDQLQEKSPRSPDSQADPSPASRGVSRVRSEAQFRLRLSYESLGSTKNATEGALSTKSTYSHHIRGDQRSGTRFYHLDEKYGNVEYEFMQSDTSASVCEKLDYLKFIQYIMSKPPLLEYLLMPFAELSPKFSLLGSSVNDPVIGGALVMSTKAPVVSSKPPWEPDKAAPYCPGCGVDFTFLFKGRV